METEFKFRLNEYKKRIDSNLEKFFDEKLKENLDPFNREVISHLKEYNLRGGKRIRAILFIIGHNCFSEENPEIIKASISMELVQSFLLIHDDIIDEDELRRGGKTFHKIYEEFHLKDSLKGKSPRFGEGIAIVSGDLLFSFVNQYLSGFKFKKENLLRAIAKINELVEKTCYGQNLDLYLNQLPINRITEKDILKVYELKSAFYTIEGPLQLGAILSGADETEFKKFCEFAIPLGIAFQIRDDIIGLFGNVEKTGKPITSDITEGKRTLLILKAIEKSKEKKFILNNLGNKDITDSDFKKLRQIVKDSGAIEYCNENIKRLVIEAKRIITASNYRQEAKSFLLNMCDYLEKRDY